MTSWYRIVELILLAVIALTLIIGQFSPRMDNDHEPGVPEGVVNLVQWSQAEGSNGHWYGIMDRELFWKEALVQAEQAMLNKQAGYLATVTSYAENDFIRNRVITHAYQPSILDAFWLGGYMSDSSWHWITNEPFVFENWSLYEPNNIKDETALSVWGPNNWGDRKRPGQWNNLLPDGQINRLHRVWSVVEWGTLDMEAKAQSYDTLINLIQWPVEAGGNDHWYGILGLDLHHDQASEMARALEKDGVKGHLASVTSPAENTFIVNQVIQSLRQPSLNDQYWLGAVYAAGRWLWSDDSQWKFEHWAPGEPNNIGVETSLSLWGPSASTKKRIPGSWNNCPPNGEVNPHAHFFSIIEFDTSN